MLAPAVQRQGLATSSNSQPYAHHFSPLISSAACQKTRSCSHRRGLHLVNPVVPQQGQKHGYVRAVGAVSQLSMAPRQRRGSSACHAFLGMGGTKKAEESSAPTSQPLSDAAPKPLDLQTASGALMKAQAAWAKYDVDNTGTLSLSETVELLNSPELRNAIRTLTNVEPTHKTEADVRALFEKADADRSGTLSRPEFFALYLSLAMERVKMNPLLLAEALLGFLDTDRNGKIDGGELRVVLAMLGFPAAFLMPIPKSIGIDYRAVLRGFSGGKS